MPSATPGRYDPINHTALAVKGDNGAWGVFQHGTLSYDPMFSEVTARRLAQLCERGGGWEQHEPILLLEGFDTVDPAKAVVSSPQPGL